MRAVWLLVLLGVVTFALASPAAGHPAAPAEQLPAPAPLVAPDVVRLQRQRRFAVFGWDLGRFLADVNLQVRRAWAASRRWVHDLFHWAHRVPHKETVYEVRFPGGGLGVIRVFEFGWHHGAGGVLRWDGHKLSWASGGHHEKSVISLTYGGKHYAAKLSALAKYLHHVPAGSRVGVEILGSSWHDLRLVLHVFSKEGHKEDSKKSVSILVSKLMKEVSGHKWKHIEKEESKKKEKESHKKLESSKQTSKKSKKSTSSSSTLVWNGKSLAWKDGGVHEDKKTHKKVYRQLRVSQDGVSHVIPLTIIANHLDKVPAGSTLSLEIHGKTLANLEIILHVNKGSKGHKTITLKAKDLIKEADVAGLRSTGKVVASYEVVKAKKPKKKLVPLPTDEPTTTPQYTLPSTLQV